MPAWELLEDSGPVKAMLACQIKETGLRTYLFTYCSTFSSLSVTMLAQVLMGNRHCFCASFLPLLFFLLFFFW